MGVLHTPDFFVIRKDSAGWEECKTEEQLKKLARKSPNRYILSESNKSLILINDFLEASPCHVALEA